MQPQLHQTSASISASIASPLPAQLHMRRWSPTSDSPDPNTTQHHPNLIIHGPHHQWPQPHAITLSSHIPNFAHPNLVVPMRPCNLQPSLSSASLSNYYLRPKVTHFIFSQQNTKNWFHEFPCNHPNILKKSNCTIYFTMHFKNTFEILTTKQPLNNYQIHEHPPCS